MLTAKLKICIAASEASVEQLQQGADSHTVGSQADTDLCTGRFAHGWQATETSRTGLKHRNPQSPKPGPRIGVTLNPRNREMPC